ncbi:MAG: GTP-binding protein [Oculatellaceae cyanobacterium Prado106]|jgi:hypothetical protein|nr:GTP-binding protein [Oculatellaceae cyanobacterium Prado106]
MQLFKTILVSEPPGVGKTTWIQQQVHTIAEPALYINIGSAYINMGSANMGSADASVDATYLAAEEPNLKVVSAYQLQQSLNHFSSETMLYVELGSQIDLNSLVLPEPMSDCQRVAVLPPGTQATDWHNWADLVVDGVKNHPTGMYDTEITEGIVHSQLWHSALTGQVFNPASLDTFWDELIHSAYGSIQRAKGIFDMVDGRSFYFDFVAGLSETRYVELNLPQWLDGRPERFSGLEVWGDALDQTAMVQTIRDCCLEDQAIAYYQQQIQQQIKFQMQQAQIQQGAAIG